MKIFIGHDSKYPQATKVCKKSMLDFNNSLDIEILDKQKLKDDGVYSREDVAGESTEFSFTRFYVPYLMNYEGIAMFCDNDFLWKCDPMEMKMWLMNNDVAVVKHEYYDANDTKMDGVVNKAYPRKNWSSLMLFDCGKLKHMTKEYLDNARPPELHELRWAEHIGGIPKVYNWLVGVYNQADCGCGPIKAYHYTNGGPWFDKYKNGEKSLEWWKVYESL